MMIEYPIYIKEVTKKRYEFNEFSEETESWLRDAFTKELEHVKKHGISVMSFSVLFREEQGVIFGGEVLGKIRNGYIEFYGRYFRDRDKIGFQKIQ